MDHGGSLASFAPSPHRTEQRQIFLAELLRLRGNVYRACERAGVARHTAYDWRNDDAEFRRDWDAALDATADDAESELVRRAYDEKGMPGVIALLAILKRYRPQLWVEKRQEQLNIDVTVHVDEMIRGVRRALLAPPQAGDGAVVEGEARELPAAEGEPQEG